MTMSEIIHVGIKEPKQHRKEILNFSIDIIQLLKKYERHKKLNKEKNLYRTHLMKNIKQLNNLLKGFHKMMPQVAIQEPRPKVVIQKVSKKAIKKAVKKKNARVKSKNKELDKFENDIASLKSKISSL